MENKNVNNSTLKDSISNLVINHISSSIFEDKKNIDLIIDALHILLNGNFEKYHFSYEMFQNDLVSKLSSDDFQIILSKINEKNEKRKENGVYYTPKDVTKYIISNLFVNILDDDNRTVRSDVKCINLLKKYDIKIIKDMLLKKDIIDPTCGAGEFLISIFEYKIQVLREMNINITDEIILNVLKTVSGNDIDENSIEISKIRLFFSTLGTLKDLKKLKKVSDILNGNFTTFDFVNVDYNNFKKYDIIIGNPPYVEYSKLTERPDIHYGNVYANVLHNSVNIMKKNGVFGFVIPISYVSTSRMSLIRNYLYHFTEKQFVLNYADRPDCLFTSVHQKLTILLACKKSSTREVLTSGYKYWYKEERKDLLNGCEMVKNNHLIDSFIPKIGNEIENNIFTKLYTTDGNTLTNLSNSNFHSKLFLNMRGTFWIKAFSFNPGSSEYKKFSYDDKIKKYIICIMNSSLFFFFWTVTSDCWHITNKELSTFLVVLEGVDYSKFGTLSNKLEKKLERTKQYIGTKQADYAYKHKECKDVIDEIDEELAKIYDLSKDETDYIKKFNIRYRMGSGVTNE